MSESTATKGLVEALFADPAAVVTEAQVEAVTARYVRDVIAATDRGRSEIASAVDRVIEEWQDTMRGDDKAAAVVRGMALELRQVAFRA